MTGCKGCLFLVDCLSKWGDDGEFRVGFAQCYRCHRFSVVREVVYEEKRYLGHGDYDFVADLPEYIDLDYPQLDFLADGCRRKFEIQNSFKCAECVDKDRRFEVIGDFP
jgi:hypothetical protein